MNKKIIAAAALALVSGAALADATLYGILDASVNSTSNVKNTTPTPNTNSTLNAMGDGAWLPSIWGIKGSEDLGAGMKASFQLESNLNITNGNSGDSSLPGAPSGKLFDRWATVGLSGSFGAVTAGEQLDPLFLQSFLNGVRLAHSASLAVNGQVAYGVVGGTQQTIANIFSSNMVTYKTPMFSNTTVQLGYQFGNTAGNNSASSGENILINYAANGLAVNGGYEISNDSTNVNKLKKGLIGANYAMGDWKFAGQWNSFKSDNGNELGGQTMVNSNGYELGASYNITSNLTGFANYTWVNDSVMNVTPTALSLAMQYSFSKRTNVYAMVNRADSKGVAGWNALYETGGPVSAGNATSAQTGIAVGVQHTF